MASLLESYKKTNDLDYQSDLNATSELYKSSKAYQEKYSFEDFVKYATENSTVKLDGSISKYITPPKYNKRNFGQLLGQSMVKQTDSTTALVDTVKDLTKEEVAELMPLKNTRRTIGGVIDTLATGTAKLPGDILSPLIGGFSGIKTKEDLLAAEKERYAKIEKTVSSVVRPIVTLGTDDIYDDDKIQRPEGMAGRLTVDFGSFIMAARNPSQAVKLFKGKGKEKVIPKKPVGKPSNASIVAANAKALRDKKIAALKGLGKAEYASQVVFADDPELQMVAGFLDDKLGTFADDNMLGDVLEYLDTDETSTASQRRLSLLFDGAAFLGAIKGTLFAGSKVKQGTQKSYELALNEIKKDPKKVQALKTYLKDPIQKVIPSFKSDIVDDVFVKTAESGMLKSP